jgi:hypothetical protein
MRVYRHPTEARTFYAPDTEPSLDLAVPIRTSAAWTITRSPSRVSSRMPAGPRGGAKPNAGSGPSGTYMGNDFRAAYVPGVSLTGSGQTSGCWSSTVTRPATSRTTRPGRAAERPADQRAAGRIQRHARARRGSGGVPGHRNGHLDGAGSFKSSSMKPGPNGNLDDISTGWSDGQSGQATQLLVVYPPGPTTRWPMGSSRRWPPGPVLLLRLGRQRCLHRLDSLSRGQRPISRKWAGPR